MSRLLVTAALLASLGLAQPAQAEYKDGALVTAMETQFKSTKNWALKAIILLALGDHFHPNGGDMVLTAVKDKDRRLRAYGLETLKRANDDTLGSICDAAMMEVLIRKRLKDRNEKVRATVLEILASHFLHSIADREGEQPRRLDPETLAVLRGFSWPGNVRQFRNVLERAWALGQGDVHEDLQCLRGKW